MPEPISLAASSSVTLTQDVTLTGVAALVISGGGNAPSLYTGSTLSDGILLRLQASSPTGGSFYVPFKKKLLAGTKIQTGTGLSVTLYFEPTS